MPGERIIAVPLPEQPRTGPLSVLSDLASEKLQREGRIEYGGVIYYRSYEDYCDD